MQRLPAAQQEPRSQPHGQLSFFEPPTRQAKGFSWQEREPKIRLTPPLRKLLAENTANNYFALKTLQQPCYHVNLYGHSYLKLPTKQKLSFPVEENDQLQAHSQLGELTLHLFFTHLRLCLGRSLSCTFSGRLQSSRCDPPDIPTRKG